MRISDWSADVCSSDLRHSREEERVRLPWPAVPQRLLRKRGWCASSSDSHFLVLVILDIIVNNFIRNHRLLECTVRLGWCRSQGKPNGAKWERRGPKPICHRLKNRTSEREEKGV